MSKVTITFDKEQVVQQLIRMVNIIPKKPIAPINEFYMFHVTSMNECHIYASDSNMSIRGSANVDADTDDFKFCIPAKLFTDTVKLLHEPGFTLTVMENVCQLKSGKSKYKMPVENAAYFSMVEEGNNVNEVSVIGSQFKEAFSITTDFINHKIDNNLKAVRLSVKNNQLVVAGGQTTLLTRHNINPHSAGQFASIAIPYSTSDVLSMLFSDKDIVDIFHDGRVAVFDNSSLRLITNTFSAKFPNIDKPFEPYTQYPFFKISATYLLDALKRIQLYSEDGVFSATFDITETNLRITAENTGSQARGEDNLEITSPKNFTIAFPCHQVIKILNALTGKEAGINTEFVRFYMPETHKMPMVMTDDVDQPGKEFLISPIMITR